MMRTVSNTAKIAALILFAALSGGCLYFQLPAAKSPRIVDNWHASYKVRVGFGHGSGVVLSADGYILTAAHVVTADPIIDVQIQTASNHWETRGARVVVVDHEYDLAVIKADGRFEDVAILGDFRHIEPGDWVYAIGYPYELEEVVSRGYVLKANVNFTSATTGQKVKNAILLDMFSGPGASGEGVFAERDGRLIGLIIGHLPLEGPPAPPYQVRWAASVGDIRWLLDRQGVPYLHD